MKSSFAVVGVLPLVSSLTAGAESKRPNIIFFFTDDQPATCTGFSGNKHIKTPNID